MTRKLFAASLTAALLGASSAQAAVDYRTVIMSGQAVPGAPGEVISLPLEPQIDARGRVAFLAYAGSFTNHYVGLFAEGDDRLYGVIVGGQQAPGTPAGAKFDTVITLYKNSYNLSPGGQLVVSAGLRLGGGGVTAANSSGLWTGTASGVSLAARTGDATPGFGTGAVFTGLATKWAPRIDASGRIAFTGNVTQAGVTTAGIWSTRDGPVGLVLRTDVPGEPAPITRLSGTQPLIGGGVVAFAGAAAVASGGTLYKGVWTDRPGTVTPVVRSRDPLPGPTPTSQADPYADFSVDINESGALVLAAGLAYDVRDPNAVVPYAVYSTRTGPLAMVAASQTAAPGTSDVFTYFGSPRITDSGQIAFRGQTRFAAGNAKYGIWAEHDGNLQLVVRQGDPAPGADGLTFGDLSEGAFTTNNDNRVAFTVGLVDATGTAAGTGVWAQNPAGQLELIARTGMQFTVAPGVVQAVSYVEFSPTFNDAYQLPIRLSFSQTSVVNAGVFVATVPEPTMVGAVAPLLLLLRRRR